MPSPTRPVLSGRLGFPPDTLEIPARSAASRVRGGVDAPRAAAVVGAVEVRPKDLVLGLFVRHFERQNDPLELPGVGVLSSPVASLTYCRDVAGAPDASRRLRLTASRVLGRTTVGASSSTVLPLFGEPQAKFRRTSEGEGCVAPWRSAGFGSLPQWQAPERATPTVIIGRPVTHPAGRLSRCSGNYFDRSNAPEGSM